MQNHVASRVQIRGLKLLFRALFTNLIGVKQSATASSLIQMQIDAEQFTALERAICFL